MDNSIQEFYNNKSIFITGGTGFVGKVLLEKLLRSCSEIDKVYLLVRPKPPQDVATRVKKLLESPVFMNLSNIKSEVFDKIEGIEGDILQPRLGLSDDNFELLTKNVNIVFHSASSIRFDDTLSTATKTNVMSTSMVIDLCKKIVNLQALVYVSTAFSNCDKKFTGETVYPNCVEPHKIISMVKWMKEDAIQLISERLVGKKITTYHLTKSMCEEILSNESPFVPSVIVRPSVVVGSWQEPLIGYTETMYHFNGILIGAGRGVLRVMHCDPNATAEIVPVDFVVNLLIASAWFKALHLKTQKEALVLNCVSGIDRPLKYGELCDYTVPVLRNKPLLFPIWYPNLVMVKNKHLALFWILLLHWLPALILDTFLVLAFQKPKLIRVMKRINKYGDITEFFLNNDFEFTNDNVKAVWKRMNDDDRSNFSFNMEELSWPQFFRGYVLGCKQYIAKEDLSTIPRAKGQMKWMRWIYHGLCWLLLIPLMACLLSVFL